MADERHLEILSKGVEAWNEWRAEGLRFQASDLSGADLTDADLRGAKLTGADLRGAVLRGAKLSGADLTDADLRGAKLRSAVLTDADLRGAKLTGAELTDAQLWDAKLTGADLTDAELTGAKLSGAKLTLAVLRGADLTLADLTGADLTDAQLSGADLTDADLRGADLTDAQLTHAGFLRTRLGGAVLSGSMMGLTNLGGLNLSQVQGLEEVKHRGPSLISTDTLYLSRGKIPEIFLRGCGVPENLISYLPSLVSPSAIDFYSCFISYSHSDKSFARRLHNDLQAKGIRCWLDEHEMYPGDDVMAKVDEGIRFWDKVLLCCSEASLSSWWVGNEIDAALAKERELMTERGERVLSLIPLNLDGYLFSGKWKSSGREVQITQRLAADFTGWESDNAQYEEQLERVVTALRTDGEGRSPKPVPKL